MLDQSGHRITRWATALAILFAGCARLSPPVVELIEPYDAAPFANIPAQIEYPDAEPPMLEQEGEWMPPRTAADGVPTEFWDLTLAEALRIGLENSAVLKNLGGRVLDQPLSVRSVFDPSITMSNPRFGEEAALAAFDAQLRESFNYSAGSQAFNNAIEGGFVPQRKDNGYAWQSALTKTAATGTEFGLRHVWQYQDNNADFNLFPNIFTNVVEASVRQPLLQGAGVGLNRIIGPGVGNDFTVRRGVLLARMDGDISIVDFEIGVREFVRDLETAYWQLYFAYRLLDANRVARDTARDTWTAVRARHGADLRGGEADQEAQAREQLYQFEQLVLTALNGDAVAGTPGIYQAERRLRRLMGLKVNDGALIRPSEEPPDVPVIFDWDECQAVALQRRAELRRQMWRVKQRQLELLAAKNFLLPRLDAVAAYRVQGFGDDFMGGSEPFSNPFREVATFDNNRVQVGLQLDVPIGYRRAFAGVRHAELNLARERAVRRDQEHLISHNLGEAIANLDTTYRTIHFNEQRMTAADEVVSSRTVLHDTGYVAINVLLESQRRLAEASINYFRGRVNHALAIRDVHLQRGTLLAYNGVHLQEGQWSACASYTAPVCTKKALHTRQCFSPVTAGQFATEFDPTGGGGIVPETIPDTTIPDTTAPDTPETVEELPSMDPPPMDPPSTESLESSPKLFDSDATHVEELEVEALEDTTMLLEPALSAPAE